MASWSPVREEGKANFIFETEGIKELFQKPPLCARKQPETGPKYTESETQYQNCVSAASKKKVHEQIRPEQRQGLGRPEGSLWEDILRAEIGVYGEKRRLSESELCD